MLILSKRTDLLLRVPVLLILHDLSLNVVWVLSLVAHQLLVVHNLHILAYSTSWGDVFVPSHSHFVALVDWNVFRFKL